jgi:hypothetical protein
MAKSLEVYSEYKVLYKCSSKSCIFYDIYIRALYRPDVNTNFPLRLYQTTLTTGSMIHQHINMHSVNIIRKLTKSKLSDYDMLNYQNTITLLPVAFI